MRKEEPRVLGNVRPSPGEKETNAWKGGALGGAVPA